MTDTLRGKGQVESVEASVGWVLLSTFSDM